MAMDSKDLPKDVPSVFKLYFYPSFTPLSRKEVSSVSVALDLPFFSPLSLKKPSTFLFVFFFCLHTLHLTSSSWLFFPMFFVNNLLGYFFIKVTIPGCCCLFFGSCHIGGQAYIEVFSPSYIGFHFK